MSRLRRHRISRTLVPMRLLAAVVFWPALSNSPAAAPPQPSAIDRWVAQGIESLTPADMEREFPAAMLRWDDSTRASLRLAPATDFPLRLAGEIDLAEVRAHFAQGKADSVLLMASLSGDPRRLSEKEFTALAKKCRTAVEKITKTPGADASRADSAGLIDAGRTQWTLRTHRIVLECAAKREPAFRAGFIRIRIENAGPAKSDPPVLHTAAAGFARNVAKDPVGGDVFIRNVPMIDQGAEGNCVLASLQRLMGYFGLKVDPQELAVLTEVGNHGARLDKMHQAIKKIDGRLRVRLREVIEPIGDRDAYERFMLQYNIAAKKRGRVEVDFRKNLYQFSSLDPVVLRDVRSKGGGVEKFLKAVREQTQKGVPLLWSLHIGLFPEQGAATAAKKEAHVRLIVGYNDKTGQILFSDSWGAGHECKRIAAADALAATTGLYVLLPAEGK